MTKKHFIEAAKRIGKVDTVENRNVLISFFVEYFKVSNALFDEKRFYSAVESEVKKNVNAVPFFLSIT